MGWTFCRGSFLLSLMVAVTLVATGCGRAEKARGKKAASKAGHDHSGWWCDEHGIPEEECSMCSAKAAAEFKKKNDWCKEHERAMSQCFICDPKAKEKYAAVYKAKLGKEPPEPTDNQPPKKEEKKG